MSDFRTRVARAAWVYHRDRQLAQLGMKPSEYAADIPIPDWAYAIADAVIRELGLREELWSTTDPVQLRRSWGKAPKYRRYVTSWEPSD